MHATLTKTNHTGKVAPNRKENSFMRQFTVITPELEDIIQLRIYGTNARNYACIWVHSSPVYVSGGGYAGGYGYHRPSAAAQVAINDAGIVLSENIAGVGDSAIENALLAIAEALGKSGCKIFKAYG